MTQLKPEFRPQIENEQYSVYSFEKMIAGRVDEYGRISHAVQENAKRIISTDGGIRRNGRRMISKYAGTDTATGRKFEAGTEIIYSMMGRAVIAESPVKGWLK